MPTLEIITGYPPFALLYALSNPVIAIRGKPVEAPWGRSTFELAAGQYDVEITVPGFFSAERGKSIVFVELVDGDAKSLRYTAPLVRFLPGTITFDDPVPAARVVHAKRPSEDA